MSEDNRYLTIELPSTLEAISELVVNAIKELKELQGSGDVEAIHQLADGILTDFLIRLGYGEIVAEWEKIEKWYA